MEIAINSIFASYDQLLQYYNNEFAVFVIIVTAIIYVVKTIIQTFAIIITKSNAGAENAHELIENIEKKDDFHVAVIGTGVSGIGAIKGCLQAGLTPTAFESDERVVLLID